MERKINTVREKDGIANLQMLPAYIEQLTIERQDTENLTVSVYVMLRAGGSKEVATATGTLNEMCVLFNAIPFKGKFLTGHLKHAPCRVTMYDGKYFFSGLENSGGQ